MRSAWLLLLCLGLNCLSSAQRTYRPNSVLATGEWFKLSTNQAGIHKIDLAFLQKLGISQNSIASNSIRMFGQRSFMLPENCSGVPKDDLQEISISVIDGGDAQFNGNDYLLFYSDGPHPWIKDSANKRFFHEKNLYSEASYYYITIGQSGKRVSQANSPTSANTLINSFNERYFFELDTVNFMGSGKQWFGEEFSTNPGKVTSRTFNVDFPGLLLGSPVNIYSNLVGRSVGSPSRFSVSLNGQQTFQVDIPATTSVPTDAFARTALGSGSVLASSQALSLRFDFTPGGFNAQGWLDWFEIMARKELSLTGQQQILFRDWNSVGPGNIGQYTIKNATGANVWKVTDPLNPELVSITTAGNEISFIQNCGQLHEYVAFIPTSLYLPTPIGRIGNQNLHTASPTDYIIITTETLRSQAQRVADLHLRRSNLRSVIVSSEQVYNEFGGGQPDPTALRDFVKMFYDRAGSDSTRRAKYLLLFGDGSFDYKNRISGNTNLVPVYESQNSLDPLSTYTSDDYFGFLDDADDINDGSKLNLLDIGIGRIPARSPEEAKAFVDKLIDYTSTQAFGSWRNNLSFVADDEDFNLHLHDAEIIVEATKSTNRDFNPDKIYLDAYLQSGGAGGARYPAVNQEIRDGINQGMLIFNYTGHGGFRRLAEEVVLDQEILNSFNNQFRLPLFITATCDFAPYDDPRINSLGENALLREKTGAIALMTTTRLVFAFSNRIMNRNYLLTAFQRKSDGNYLSLGEAVKYAKNFTYQTFGDIINNRKFTLLGDPALQLSFPLYRVQTTTINGRPASTADTLKALQECKINGQVNDGGGSLQTGFNGTAYISVYDKEQTISTLGNDADSYAEQFKVQRNLIYKGKAKVVNGLFEYSFIVPKDINYQVGPGLISYYVENGSVDGNGNFRDFSVGGSGNAIADNEGPGIRAWLNDEKFVNGSISNEEPILLLKLEDSSGINILGTGIGHDLVAILDNDPKKSFVLNRFYEAELDNFRKGQVRYQLPTLAEGDHTLTIKAWDVVNNSNEIVLDFQVKNKVDLVLSHVLNYPNPFTTRTTFWFEHNHPFEPLQVSVQIYSPSGKLVKTIAKTIISEGNRSTEIEWNGTDDFGDKIGRGVYIYLLKVRTADGKQAQKFEKLYIL